MDRRRLGGSKAISQAAFAGALRYLGRSLITDPDAMQSHENAPVVSSGTVQSYVTQSMHIALYVRSSIHVCDMGARRLNQSWSRESLFSWPSISSSRRYPVNINAIPGS